MDGMWPYSYDSCDGESEVPAALTRVHELTLPFLPTQSAPCQTRPGLMARRTPLGPRAAATMAES